MVKHTFAIALTVVTAAASIAAVPPVRTMYNDTMTREQTVRTVLASEDAPASVAERARQVVARYEALVRHYPASGYSDNALWQAAQLSLDLFAKFGLPQDRDAGLRLLKLLAASYPTSRLAKRVPELLPHVEAPASTTGVVSAPSPPPSTATTTTATTSTTTAANVATIKSIRRSVLPDAVRVVIELDGEVPFHEERIADPSRVFVDLPGTRPAAALLDKTLRFETDADVVRQVRIGRHPNSTTRVVLDAAGVSSYSVYPLYEPYRLVIDCMRAEATTTVAAAVVPAPVLPPQPALLQARGPSTWLRSAPSNTPQHGVLLAEARTPEPRVIPPTLPPPAPIAPPMAAPAEAPAAPPVRNSNGGFSIARQLGLGVSRIVIDPGHGGHDPGAQGKGVAEAELVLDVALRLEKLLQKAPGVDVILTRRTDEFIALQERTAIANREGADLFLSIHANASQSQQAHGVETYFLNFASNLSAAAVAARENAASGQQMGALPDIVKSIALNNKLDESRDFAGAIQRAMVQNLKTQNKLLRDLGVKQAPFVVLIGAAMPSVLAEISFVTNAQEAKLLKGNAYRQKIAEALYEAIRKYQTSLKGLTSVALP